MTYLKINQMKNLEQALLLSKENKYKEALCLFEKHFLEIKEEIDNEHLDIFIDTLIADLNIDLSEDNEFYQNVITDISNSPKKYYSETILSWGKHNGKSIKDILENEASYIEWCIKNLNHFYVSDEVIVLLFLKKRTIQITPNTHGHFVHAKYKAKDSINEAIKINIIKDHYQRNQIAQRNNHKSGYSNGASEWGYDSWEEMTFYDAYEGNEGLMDI